MEKSTKHEQVYPRSTVPYSEAVKEIDAAISKMPDSSPDLWMKRAAALTEQNMIREAIDSLSHGIAIDPFCGILYRWRAHRYLNCGEIEQACADFTIASRLIPENWSVWYHLGLSYVLMGEFDHAAYAYEKCWTMPTTVPRLVALTNWAWITYKNLGENEKAEKLLEKISADLNAGGNIGYLYLCLLYKGELSIEDIVAKSNAYQEEGDPVSAITQSFGLANYYCVQKDWAKYEETLTAILKMGEEDNDGWRCFGYQGARYWRTKANRT